MTIFPYLIHYNFNNSLFSSVFASELRKADIIPIHKKKSKFDIFPILCKIYKRFTFDQMYSYFNQILSKHLWIPTRSQHSTQPSSYSRKKLKKSLDNSSVGEMLLTGLSKTFNCLRHDLLIAKLAAHGFDEPSLCFIFSYHSDRSQRTKVNNADVSYTNIKYGVPQGFIRDPLLFDIVFVIYFCGTINATQLVMQKITQAYTSKAQLVISFDSLQKTT